MAEAGGSQRKYDASGTVETRKLRHGRPRGDGCGAGVDTEAYSDSTNRRARRTALAAYYNDIEPFPCRVLEARIAEGRLPDGTVDQLDIAEVDATDLVRYDQWHLFAGIGGFPLGLRLAGIPDDFPVLTGGFPCQDISTAGKGAGIDGARSGLFWRLLDVVRVLRPPWLFLENVPALRTRGYDRVADALEAEGYSLQTVVVGAWAVGAPHRRDRVWIVAHRSERGQRTDGSAQRDAGHVDERGERMANTQRDGRRIGEPGQRPEGRTAVGGAGEGVDNAEGDRRSGNHHVEEIPDQRTQQQQAEHSSTVPRNDRQSECPNMADTGSERRQSRCEPRGSQTPGGSPPATSSHESDTCRWPARPGEPQHEWEAPRLIEFDVGGAVDGLPVRLARFANRGALRALGNSVVPQVVAAIAREFLTPTRPQT